MSTQLPLPYVPIDPRIAESQRFHDFVQAGELWDDPYAEFYIYKLITFAGRARIDGNLGRIHPRMLVRELRWPHQPDRLLPALVGSGWLIELEDGGYRIEGWERHGGLVLEKRHKERDRKAAQRAHGAVADECPADVPPLSAGHPRDVTRTVDVEVEVEVEVEEEQEQEPVFQQHHQRSDADPPGALVVANAADARALCEATAGWGYRPPSPLQMQTATRLQPFAAAEVGYARTIVAQELAASGRKRGNLGLLLSVIERSRQQPRAPPCTQGGLTREDREVARSVAFANTLGPGGLWGALTAESPGGDDG